MEKQEIKRILTALDTLNFAERIPELNRLRSLYGESFDALVSEHVAEQTHEEWSVLASIHPRNTIAELIDIQWEHISRSGGFEFNVVDQGTSATIHCTHCPLAEMAKQIDATHWGYLYYCQKSATSVTSFNPRLGFSRAHTLMQGSSYCDHHYFEK